MTASPRSRPNTSSHDASLDESLPLLPSSPGPEPAIEKPWLRVVVTVGIIIFLCDLGSYVALPSFTRLYEAIICYQYYLKHDPSQILPDGSVPERFCKVNEVQDTVALLFGWQNVWDALPGLTLAIPFGSLADRWGRKPVLLLALSGVLASVLWIISVCYFQLPIFTVWLSSAWMLIGGGPIVVASVLFTAVSDVVPAERRTAAYLWLNAAVLSGEMLGPVISSPAMKKSIWLPLVIAISIMLGGLTGVLFLPETLHDSSAKQTTADSDLDEIEPSNGIQGWKAKLFQLFRETWTFIFHDRNITLIVLSSTTTSIGVQAIQILLQYASKRYNWAIADAALLGTLRAAVNLVLFLAILPWLMDKLTKRLRLHIEKANLEISKWSAILMMAGFFIVGLSPNAILMVFGLIIYTCGTAFTSSLRSVAVELVGGTESPHLAKLFSTMGVLSSIGSMVSGPLLPLAFHWGQEIGGIGLGLPFIIAGSILGLASIFAFLVRLPDQYHHRYQEEYLDDGAYI